MDRAQTRSEFFAHCLWLLERAGRDYAIHAADWYEKTLPDWLSGLGARIRREAEKRLVEVADAT